MLERVEQATTKTAALQNTKNTSNKLEDEPKVKRSHGAVYQTRKKCAERAVFPDDQPRTGRMGVVAKATATVPPLVAAAAFPPHGGLALGGSSTGCFAAGSKGFEGSKGSALRALKALGL